jgi:hypothetical protein
MVTIVIFAAFVLLALTWAMTQGRNNRVSDRIGPASTETSTAGGVTSGEGQSGGNQSTDEGQPITGH